MTMQDTVVLESDWRKSDIQMIRENLKIAQS
jgi:hypothetical protein